jgi:dienelactone hydrolase
LYGAIISMEGYGDPGEGGRAMLSTQAQFDAHSPSLYVNTMTFAHPVPVFFGVAGNGNAADRHANEVLAADLQKRGQTVSFETVPDGYHTWHTARALLPQALIFVSEQLKSGSST